MRICRRARHSSSSGECLHTLQGHAGAVHTVAFSPDLTVLATGGRDGTARLWDLATGQCLHTLQGHADTVYRVAFSPDGTLLVTGSYDSTARLFGTRVPGAPLVGPFAATSTGSWRWRSAPIAVCSPRLARTTR